MKESDQLILSERPELSLAAEEQSDFPASVSGSISYRSLINESSVSYQSPTDVAQLLISYWLVIDPCYLRQFGVVNVPRELHPDRTHAV